MMSFSHNGLFYTFLVIVLTNSYSEAMLTSSQIRSLHQACPGHENCYENHITESCCLPCSCDTSVCDRKGNCCPDVQAANQTTQIANQTETMTHRTERNSNLSAERSCVTTTINLNKVQKQLSKQDEKGSKSHLGVTMVTGCLSTINETRCTDPDATKMNQSTPIFDFDNGLTYRNIFCAQCNNVSNDNSSNFEPWKVFITCSKVNVIKADILLFPSTADTVFTYTATTNYHACGIDFLPPNGVDIKQDFCFEETRIARQCPDDFNDLSVRAACGDFYMPYISAQENETFVYGNYFCYLCNTINKDTDNHTCPSNIDLYLHEENELVAELSTDMNAESQIIPPLTKVELTPASYIPSGVRCKEQTTFDPFMENCREWYCPNGRQRVGENCIPIYNDVIKAKYSISLKITPDSLSKDVFERANKSILTDDIFTEMFGRDSLITTEIIVLSIMDDNSYMYTFLLVSVERDSVNKSVLFDETTYDRDIAILTDNGTVSVHVEFAVGIKIELSTYPLSDIVIIDLIQYSALINIYRVDVEAIKSSFKHMQINKMSFCTQVLLHRSEIHDYIDIFDIIKPDTRINTGEFARTTNYEQIRICLADYLRDAGKYLEEKRKSEAYSPQAIVSVICNMMSIAGLLITILTYVVFDELRSIPGKNNLMLSVHLLFAQVLYQFGMDQTETPKLCIALGVFIHLFWLTAIFWMNACTLHMFRTFVTGQSYRSVRALDPQVCCYALYCYGIAISMVAINITVSMYRSNGQEIGYGGRVCYISNPVMVGWVFALPVGVIIILNMGFFFAVVYQISASTMRRRGKSTDRANTVIYMKLSSLTGVTWIFGYLYLWTDFTPLEYIFIVLNAGQGVFIFISFICTQRITKLYWNLFRKHCRSCRENRSCMCMCTSKMDESEANAVEMNTAKISLTAASITKGFHSRKRKNESKSGSNNKTHSSTDIIKDSSKIAKQLCNPVANGNGHVESNSEINMDFVNYNAGGVVSEGLQNGLQNIAIATIGLHDIEFIPAKNGE